MTVPNLANQINHQENVPPMVVGDVRVPQPVAMSEVSLFSSSRNLETSESIPIRPLRSRNHFSSNQTIIGYSYESKKSEEDSLHNQTANHGEFVNSAGNNSVANLPVKFPARFKKHSINTQLRWTNVDDLRYYPNIYEARLGSNYRFGDFVNAMNQAGPSTSRAQFFVNNLLPPPTNRINVSNLSKYDLMNNSFNTLLIQHGMLMKIKGSCSNVDSNIIGVRRLVATGDKKTMESFVRHARAEPNPPSPLLRDRNLDIDEDLIYHVSQFLDNGWNDRPSISQELYTLNRENQELCRARLSFEYQEAQREQRLEQYMPIFLKRQVRQQMKQECAFCVNNQENEDVSHSHMIKDISAQITACPLLRLYLCPICGGTGDIAHTLRYCSKNHATIFQMQKILGEIDARRKVKKTLEKVVESVDE